MDSKRLDDLVALPFESPGIEGKTFAQIVVAPHDAPENERKEALGVSQSLDVAHMLCRPGTRTVPHSLSDDWYIQVTGGSGVISTGTEEIEVGPGVAVFIPAGEVSSFRATSDSDFTFLSIHAAGADAGPGGES